MRPGGVQVLYRDLLLPGSVTLGKLGDPSVPRLAAACTVTVLGGMDGGSLSFPQQLGAAGRGGLLLDQRVTHKNGSGGGT